jgi:hypothetical protein
MRALLGLRLGGVREGFRIALGACEAALIESVKCIFAWIREPLESVRSARVWWRCRDCDLGALGFWLPVRAVAWEWFWEIGVRGKVVRPTTW